MKSEISVTRNAIPDKDRNAWLHYVKLVENRKNTKAPDFVAFAEKVFQLYPQLPNKMVWGSYLIADIDEDFMDFQIDHDNANEIVEHIIQLANEHGYVAWANGKIYRP